MVERVHSRAPCRITFGGGGTDIEEYFKQYGGCAVNAAIRKYAYVSRSARFTMSNIHANGSPLLLQAVANRLSDSQPAGGLACRVEVPPLSGLGASAAIAVAAVATMTPGIGRQQAAEEAYTTERKDLRVAGGYQDQFAAAYGGILYMEFGDGRVRVERLDRQDALKGKAVSQETILDLEKHLVMVFVQARVSVDGSDVIGDQISRLREKETLKAHHKIKEIALEMRRVLRAHDMEMFGDLLEAEWFTKKTFSPLMSNEYIDGIYDFARRHGARGGKLMGAGGGGHLLLYCPETEAQVAQKLRETGLHPESVSFDWEGVRTWRS